MVDDSLSNSCKLGPLPGTAGFTDGPDWLEHRRSKGATTAVQVSGVSWWHMSGKLAGCPDTCEGSLATPLLVRLLCAERLYVGS